MRSNFDYIFLLAEDFISNEKDYMTIMLEMFPSFDMFQQVFSDVTENYGCMVIDNRVHSKDITKKVFWYKAKVTLVLRLEVKNIEIYRKKNYNSNWNKEIKTFDASSLITKKKNKIRFIVEKVKK